MEMDLELWHKGGIDMTFSQMIGFSKLFVIALGLDCNMSINRAELKSACEMLKIMADERNDWDAAQKEIYKVMVDTAKQQTERQIQ